MARTKPKPSKPSKPSKPTPKRRGAARERKREERMTDAKPIEPFVPPEASGPPRQPKPDERPVPGRQPENVPQPDPAPVQPDQQPVERVDDPNTPVPDYRPTPPKPDQTQDESGVPPKEQLLAFARQVGATSQNIHYGRTLVLAVEALGVVPHAGVADAYGECEQTMGAVIAALTAHDFAEAQRLMPAAASAATIFHGRATNNYDAVVNA